MFVNGRKAYAYLITLPVHRWWLKKARIYSTVILLRHCFYLIAFSNFLSACIALNEFPEVSFVNFVPNCSVSSFNCSACYWLYTHQHLCMIRRLQFSVANDLISFWLTQVHSNLLFEILKLMPGCSNPVYHHSRSRETVTASCGEYLPTLLISPL